MIAKISRLFLAVSCVLTVWQAAAQRPLLMEQSAEQLSLLRKVGFENLGDRQVEEPLRIRGIVFRNFDTVSPCEGCDPANPEANPVLLHLNQGQFPPGTLPEDYDTTPRGTGGTITFPHLPRYVIIETLNLGEGDFEFILRAGNTESFRLSRASFGPFVGAPFDGSVGRGLWGIEVPRGVRQMELRSYEDPMGDFGPMPINAVYFTKVATPTDFMARAVLSTQVNLTWKYEGTNQSGFIIYRGAPVDLVQYASVGRNVRSFRDTVLPTNTYYYAITANHPDGESALARDVVSTVPEFQLRLRSIAAEDGFVCEDFPFRNQGTRAILNGSAGQGLIAGDFHRGEQCKAIVSFDTSAVPDHSRIVSARLILRRGAHSGSPLATLGPLLVDINSGEGFGGSPELRASDFEADADALRVATVRPARGDSTRDIAVINSTAFSRINTTGRTQFRLYFSEPDDGDFSADYIGWYSGENLENAPVLEIIYRRPTSRR